MKIFLIFLISFFEIFSSSSNKVISIIYVITNKLELSHEPSKQPKQDFWVDSLMGEMFKNTRIAHEFELKSELGITSISKYRLISQINPRISMGPYSFKDNYWFAENLINNPEMYSVDYLETTEQKKILGYECIKYLGKKKTKDSLKMEIWASKQLPSYVNPVVGLTNFPYGILEAYIGDNAEIIQAKEINQ